MTSSLRQPLRNLGLKALSLPLEKGARIALVIGAARQLGEVAFGRYAFASTVTTLLVLVTDLGLGIYTTRELARDREAHGRLVSTGLLLKLAASLAYALFCVGVAFALGPGETRLALLLLGGATLAQSWVEHLDAIFRGHERLIDEARLNVLTAVAALAGGLLLLWQTRSLVGLCAGVLAGHLVGLAYGATLLVAYGRPRLRDFDPKLARHIPAEALPLGLAAILSLVYFKADVVLVRFVAGDAQTGTYGAAFKLFEGTMIAPAAIMAALFPQVARRFGDHAAQRRWEVRLGAVLLGAGLLAGAVLALGADLLSSGLLGPRFRGTAPSLRVLGLGVPLLFLNYGLTHFLVGRNLGRKHLAFAAVLVVVNLGANVLLVPCLGGLGAAWATVITEVVLTALCLRALSRAGQAEEVNRQDAKSAQV